MHSVSVESKDRLCALCPAFVYEIKDGKSIKMEITTLDESFY